MTENKGKRRFWRRGPRRRKADGAPGGSSPETSGTPEAEPGEVPPTRDGTEVPGHDVTFGGNEAESRAGEARLESGGVPPTRDGTEAPGKKGRRRGRRRGRRGGAGAPTGSEAPADG